MRSYQFLDTKSNSESYGTFGRDYRGSRSSATSSVPNHGRSHTSFEMSNGNSFKKGLSLPSNASSRYVFRQLEHIPRININRTAMDQQNLELWTADSGFSTQPTVGDKFRECCPCTGDSISKWDCKGFFCRLVPILEWVPRYHFGRDFVSDLIAGLTLAVMQVPQGMAYAMLANVPPVVGLYTSFFPALVYFLLGTSRHGSIGTFALISMLTNTAMEDVLGSLRTERMAVLYPNGTMTNFSSEVPFHKPDDEDLGINTTEVAVVVAFIVGLTEILMGIARLGYLTVLMSDKMISGLITGTAVQVITSQLKPITGVHVAKYSGMFNTVFGWISFCERINTIQWAVSLVSLCSFAFLFLVKFLIDPQFKKKTNVPFPSELILVMVATVFSYCMDFEKKYSMDIIGDIPTGLVTPKVPTFSFIPQLLTGSAMVTVVGVSLSLSIVLSYGKKHNYNVDSNQELLAYGAANVAGSFFSCIPCSISLSRSAVLDSSGAKSQMASLVSCVVLLVVILALGPLFGSLPDAVLSVIIVMALRSLLARVDDLFTAWKASKAEAAVWLSTFLGVVILDIDYGLAIGVFVSLFCFLLKAHKTGEIFLLGRLSDTEIYLNIDKYHDSVKEVDDMKIYGIPGPVYFGNREYIKTEILKDVDSVLEGISHVIISFAAVSFIDIGGVDAMKMLSRDLEDRGVIMFLAAPTDSVLNMMQKCDYFPNLSAKSVIFPTIHDAVVRASYRDHSHLEIKSSPIDNIL